MVAEDKTSYNTKYNRAPTGLFTSVFRLIISFNQNAEVNLCFLTGRLNVPTSVVIGNSFTIKFET